MNKKRLFFYIIAATFVILLLAPVPVTDFAYRIPLINSVKIFVDEKLKIVEQSIIIIKDLQNVGERNVTLEQEITRLKIELIMNEGIKKENEELSRLLKIKDTYSKYTIIPATFLGYNQTNPNKITVYFSDEYEKRIAINSTVVSSMGLVGIVRSFKNNNAEIELITSKQFSVPAVLESREECTAVVRGTGTGIAILYLDKLCNNPSSAGKKLLSANLSQNYSLPYIPIGIIGDIKDDESNVLFVRGEAIPLFQKGRLNHLFIIVGENFKEER